MFCYVASELQAAFTLWPQGAHASQIRFLHDSVNSSNLLASDLVKSDISHNPYVDSEAEVLQDTPYETVVLSTYQHNNSTFNALNAQIRCLYVCLLP